MATPQERRLPRSGKQKRNKAKPVNWKRASLFSAAAIASVGLGFGVWQIVGKVRSGEIALPSIKKNGFTISRESTFITEPLTETGDPLLD